MVSGPVDQELLATTTCSWLMSRFTLYISEKRNSTWLVDETSQVLLRFCEVVTLFHQPALRFMSSAPASSWDTRVASAMMTVLQCLMFLGFYFAARHAKSTA